MLVKINGTAKNHGWHDQYYLAYPPCFPVITKTVDRCQKIIRYVLWRAEAGQQDLNNQLQSLFVTFMIPMRVPHAASVLKLLRYFHKECGNSFIRKSMWSKRAN